MKTTIELPYDLEKIRLDIDDQRLAGVLVPPPAKKQNDVARSGSELVKEALAHPVGSDRLRDLVRGKNRITIITSDHTRSVPSAITLPLLLEEIRDGNPDADITIIVATGLHRGMTKEEMNAKFGPRLVAKERIINHDAFDADMFIDLGVLPSGSKCEINRLAIETDLLVAEGFIEPHFFAGYSGGRKSVLPGIASQDCVNINHSAMAIAHPKAITGVLDGNPIHEDMITAARMANLAFILNVLLDEDKNISAAVAGEVEQAHRLGCSWLQEAIGIDPIMADIVITTNGGYPLDQNLYQCPKGLSTALATANEHAAIILVAACKDGLGGDNFAKLMRSGSPDELMEKILATPPEKTVSEQWCVQRFAEALQRHPIILVSELDADTVRAMGFIHAHSVEQALEEAFRLKGESANVTVIPDGVSVIIRSQ